MQIIRFQREGGGPRLGAVVDEQVYDLTEREDLGGGSLSALLTREEPVDAVLERLQRTVADASPTFEMFGLLDSGHQAVSGEKVQLLRPIDEQEVWAAGVTYKRSEEARKAESEGAARYYGLVYEADRPELFFKATPHRTVGAHGGVGIRKDASWNVPEPELGVVLTRRLEVFGYTIGNDMSSRDIEGQNPLYLPQAKVYDKACSLGPGITLASDVKDPHDLGLTLTIQREGETVFKGETSTREMKRSIADLVQYLGRSNSFPSGAVLLTGTGVVPDDSFTLEQGDVVVIHIDGLGTLRNPVERVG